MNNQDQLSNLMAQLGNFGKYQFVQHCLHSLAWFTAGVHLMSFVFVFPVMEHRCFIAEVDDFHNASLEFEGIDVYIPRTLKGDLDQCLRFREGNRTKTCNDGYVYNSPYFASSRTIDFDMVCERNWMRALLQSIFLTGTLFGAFICGQLADKYGRKPVFCISGILQGVFGVTGVFLKTYGGFAMNMFMYGLFGASGALVPSVALTMELVGAKARNVCGTMFTVWFGLGAVVVAGWAYFLPVSAYHLQFIYAMHSIFLFGHFWLMDESICWLWTNNQREKAIKIVEKAVKMNGGKFINPCETREEEPQMTEIDLNEPNDQAPTESRRKKEAKAEFNSPNYSVLDLFRFPNLRTRTLVMLYCWFASSLTYFGLSFNSVNLFGNPFLMFFINIMVEVPGHFISIFVVAKTGNKPLFSYSLLITGLACVVVALISGGIIIDAITMAAKVTATVAFNIINSYTAELFPTCLRNTAIGICVMAARSGAAIIPEIDLLASAAEEIPTITFGTFGIFAGLFALFMLPETMNQTIPQTIEDVENEKSTKEMSLNLKSKKELVCMECAVVVP